MRVVAAVAEVVAGRSSTEVRAEALEVELEAEEAVVVETLAVAAEVVEGEVVAEWVAVTGWVEAREVRAVEAPRPSRD